MCAKLYFRHGPGRVPVELVQLSMDPRRDLNDRNEISSKTFDCLLAENNDITPNIHLRFCQECSREINKKSAQECPKDLANCVLIKNSP